MPAPIPKNPRFVDKTGRKFGRLEVLGYAGKSAGGHRWLCRCDCGVEKTVYGCNLASGNTESCGYLHREGMAAIGRATRTHGMHATPEFKVWTSMRRRCHNPNNPSFADYGGRGIAVCDEWRKSFAAFYAHIGPRPTPKHQLDRIDNDGHYEPGNVRWATAKANCRNKRNNRTLIIDDQELCISEWAERYAISHQAIRARINLGWSIADAVSLPPGASREG